MEVDGLGARCALPSCRSLDYLPFRCKACNLQFCQTHQHPADHACTVARPKTVPLCPLCAAPVPVPRNMSVDAAVSRHIEAGCPKRPRSNPVCAHSSCNVRDAVPTKCAACGLTFCLAHRLEQDHNCTAKAPALKNPRSRFPGISSIRRTYQQHQSPPPQSPPKKKQPPSKPAANLSVAKRQTYRLDFFNKPTAPLGDPNIDVEYRAPFAVVFPPSCNIQARYMFFSRKYSAGKIVDSIRKYVPQLPSLEKEARYSLYAVKQDLSSINLLPYITPLTELTNVVGPNDYLVLDTSPNGLDPAVVTSLRAGRSSIGLSSSSSSKRDGKCTIM